MTASSARSPLLPPLQRWVALGCVAVVLGLSWLAADPAAHAALHAAEAGGAHAGCDHEPGQDHDAPAAPCDAPSCAITRFLTGAADLLALVFLVLLFVRSDAAARWQVFHALPDRAPFAWPAPSCGPPVRA